MMGHMDAVKMVAFSPDGKRAFSGSDDGYVIIWDTETGAEVSSAAGGPCVWRGDEGVFISHNISVKWFLPSHSTQRTRQLNPITRKF